MSPLSGSVGTGGNRTSEAVAFFGKMLGGNGSATGSQSWEYNYVTSTVWTVPVGVTRINVLCIGGGGGGSGSRVHGIDCLLYTSPSPRDS